MFVVKSTGYEKKINNVCAGELTRIFHHDTI